MVLAFCGQAAAATIDLGFDESGLGAGNITGTESAFISRGVEIDLLGATGKSLALFQSTCRFSFGGTTYNGEADACTGQDPDLGTASGLGTGPQGLILIANEGSDAQPDDFAGSYSFRYSFASPVLVDVVEMVDLDGAEDIAFRGKAASGGPVFDIDPSGVSLVGTPTKDNSLRAYTLGNELRLSEFYIDFKSTSGAVGSLSYTAVPLPASLPMLIGALGLIGWAAHRRRT